MQPFNYGIHEGNKYVSFKCVQITGTRSTQTESPDQGQTLYFKVLGIIFAIWERILNVIV